jgi:FMN reductase
MSGIGIVVGNPKPQSRTLEVAEAVATATAAEVGLAAAERIIVDLAHFGPLLFDWTSTRVSDAVNNIAACSLVIVASPTYKASYTGLLKAFLDWFTTSGLRGVTVIPVMVGAGPRHALAVEVHLRPVLIEIGATLPSRGLYVTEAELGELDDVIGAWLSEAAPRVRAALAVPEPGRGI